MALSLTLSTRPLSVSLSGAALASLDLTPRNFGVIALAARSLKTIAVPVFPADQSGLVDENAAFLSDENGDTLTW